MPAIAKRTAEPMRITLGDRRAPSCRPGDDGDERLGQRRAQRGPHGDQRQRRMARGEGEDQELALVAELGDEDGAEGQRGGADEGHHRVEC